MTVKGFNLPDTLQYVRSSFKYLAEIKKIETFLINEWLFDDLEYPDAIADEVKKSRSFLNDKNSFVTVSSTKKAHL